MPEPIPTEAEQPAEDTCRIVEVPDIGPVRVLGGRDFTVEDAAAFAELMQAARRRYIVEHGEPDV